MHELVGADFGDVRLSDRLVRLVEQFSEHPESSTPQACGSAAATKAAYRFWDNPAVSPEAILWPHADETADRAAEHRVLLVAQDTTEINLTTHGKATGLGYLGSTDCRGLLLHSLLAISPHGVPLGLLHQHIWRRPLEEMGKRRQRNSKPVDQKESRRWLDGLAAAEAALPEHPQVVVVGDRESDLYDLFSMPRRPQTDLLVRVRDQRRRVEHRAKYLRDALRESPPRAEITIEVPRADGRPRRQARLTLRWARLTVCRPANHLGPPPEKPVRLWFLLAEEENPPPGQTPILWLLVTTLPITNVEDAVRLLQWYLFRWRIEEFHYVLKSGCRIEQRQLATAERMQRAIATFSIVAWRLLWLTYEARRTPEVCCTRVLETDAWQVLYLKLHPRRPLPSQPPTLAQAVRWIARLGGFLDRKHDGQPGVTTLWRGWRRLDDLVLGYRIATNTAPHPPPASIASCGQW